MNLKLNEWNECCEYAKEVCENLKSKGINVSVKTYSLYDERKGIYFLVYDNMDNFFEKYATGIHTNIEDMKKSIDTMALRIISEV